MKIQVKKINPNSFHKVIAAEKQNRVLFFMTFCMFGLSPLYSLFTSCLASSFFSFFVEAWNRLALKHGFGPRLKIKSRQRPRTKAFLSNFRAGGQCYKTFGRKSKFRNLKKIVLITTCIVENAWQRLFLSKTISAPKLSIAIKMVQSKGKSRFVRFSPKKFYSI